MCYIELIKVSQLFGVSGKSAGMKLFIFVLLSVSSVSAFHLDEEFGCTSREFVSSQVVCDFRKDCKDGSDEKFCGTCDFEDHSCGWKDASEPSYRWMRQMANITTIPGNDHTTGTPNGHVMHIDGKQEGSLFQKAELEFYVNHLANIGCQIRFWYHLSNETSGLTSLYVNMVRGERITNLQEIRQGKTNGWENATAFIGNQPGGYKLQFSYSPSFMERKDVMLDDISFEYCGDEGVPSGSDRLSCDFEDDICSWYYDYTSSLQWQRIKPHFNGIEGNGYFMLIETAYNVNTSASARLISYPQPADQILCVSFWYHIFGNSIGSLKFITKHSEETETVVWMRSGTQGNKWRFADLTFNSNKPIQFIIEAVVGGTQGSIAIDDIVVTTSGDGSCPPERECTFQGSFCGLLPHSTANFSWERVTGTTQPVNSSGPSVDHTLQTAEGYYLSAGLWKHPTGSKGAMTTAEMEPTPFEGECLMFWYYMEGMDVGEFSIYLQPVDSIKNATKLWTRRGDQGAHWRHGRVTLISPEKKYQVIFEATAGDALRRDVAIDDLNIFNSACPPTGFCDFEMDFCFWINSPPVKLGVEWDWLSGASEGLFVPSRDHTTGSALGHFALFNPSESNETKIAQLESESMEAVDRACLELWHYANSWLVDRPSDITLTVFVREAEVLRPVWNTSGYTNRRWILDRVAYSASGPHQIILQAILPPNEEGSFALDDIHILRDLSCDDINPSTTPNPPTTTTSPPSNMDCMFEQDLCNWVQEDNDDMNWSLSSGLDVKGLWDGPHYDHTLGNNEGFFLLLNGSGSKDDEEAVISIPVSDVGSETCFTFWYYMLGPSVSSLDLLIEMNSSEMLLWTRHGTQNPEWIKAQVTIEVDLIEKMMFSGHRNLHSRGFIAIDDITLRQGACSNENACGFDWDLCGFENSFNHKGRWVRTKGSKHQTDHTYGTENGFYMTVMTPNSKTSEVAELLTPEFTSASEICVRFWYWLPANSSNTLTIHVLRSEELSDSLWQRVGSPSTGWEVAEVTVSSPAKFHVVFRTSYAPGTNNSVKLDDISVMDGACSPPGSCDFESGQCTWVNVPGGDLHDWVLANGGSYGPPADHTTETPEGWFLLSSSLHKDHSSVARVVSEWIHLNDPSFCLTFWYHMNNSDSESLRVYVQSDQSDELELFQTNSSKKSWSRFSQSVNMSKPFKLLIEAETNRRGFIAVDDISIRTGLCKVNETSSGFGGCSFENGTCDWEDMSMGQFQWLRGRNATGNVGPSVDNTLGTEQGWYMVVEAYKGPQIGPAILQSPYMRNASTTCTLHFYYNMNGEDTKLNVQLKEDSRTTTLWWLFGNHGGLWQHGEVVISRITHDFSIQFEASQDLDEPGHVALDDISFTNCFLPEPQPGCPDHMFMCNNNVCVNPNLVCDFSDDCGDRSDENDCDKYDVLERCDFEQGMCFWESDVKTPEAGWSLQKGQDAWPNDGPPRDHTLNSAAGYYITPVIHLSAKEKAEILSKTLLPSSNCTVRFFYFSMDDSLASLTAHSRTQTSGSGDKLLWERETSHSYSWQRSEIMFSSLVKSKVVFGYVLGEHNSDRVLVALDDISFSKECVFDPENNELPDTPTTFPPSTQTTPILTSPTNPCQHDEFFCQLSAGSVCIPDTSQCDYHSDCPKGEDEFGCGPCTFESDQCQWTDTGDGQTMWQRQRANNNSEPPTDHTTQTGFYMAANISHETSLEEAKLQSPPLPPSSPYCQMLFHFHISLAHTGSLRVLMQQADGSEAILWSRSHNTISHWTPEHLPIGQHQQPYKVWFSAINNSTTEVTTHRGHVVAVDDISFINCEKSYVPPDLTSYGCTFENGLCAWIQGAEDELDWLSRSGPTETPNTGPAGDHTTGEGKYLYINSSDPSVKGFKAVLKSSLLPVAGDKEYCFTFWYHMFGATMGSLKMFLQRADQSEKTLIWQKSGNQGDEWLLAQIHVTLQSIHQVVLDATVGGQAGDIAIDDISFTQGSCHSTDLCDFEEDSCNWQQDTGDEFDWVRQSGHTLKPNTGPDSDHTTNTATGHYYYLPSSINDQADQKASMFSLLYPADKGSCLQLWYHMYGKGMGTLNVYKENEGGRKIIIFSQTGDQGRLWRFAQASLLPQNLPYRIVIEGVKSGPTLEGDMAIDDVQLTDSHCLPHGICDFESSFCSWSNLGGEVDQGDWLRGSGASPNPNTGPTVDHTTNSTHGYYVYVDSSVGEWGDYSFLISDVFQPSSRGHCLIFWYHMFGDYVGTLKVYINDRERHAGGDEEGLLKWIKTGNQGDKWHAASVTIKHKDAFWFVFVYQRGMNTGGDVALDDIMIYPTECDSDSPTDPPDGNVTLSVGLIVGLTLLAGVIIFIFIFVLNRKRIKKNMPIIMSNDEADQISVFGLSNCRTDDTNGPESDLSFSNILYDPSPNTNDDTLSSSEA